MKRKINLQLKVSKEELRKKLDIKDGNNYVLTDDDKQDIAKSVSVPPPVIKKIENEETPFETRDKLVSIKEEKEKLPIKAVGYLQEKLDELWGRDISSAKGGIRAGSSRIKKFLGLDDTPNSYVGEALKIVRVNAAGTGLEFVTSAMASPVDSVFGRTGDVVAQSGDYNTSQVTELTNLYFTDARAVTALTGQNVSLFVNDSGYLTSGTGVTSVSGTSNRITSTGGTTPVIDISASYVGQSSITTLGTITTGVWNGTIVTAAKGGTGLDSSGWITGDIPYMSATGVWNHLASVTQASFLRSGNTSTAPSWSTTKWPNSATTGSILYATTTNTYANLAAVAVGNVLLSGGVATDPAWGKVTSSHIDATVLSAATAASTYQPLDSDLTTIAGLTATTDNFIVSVASAWASRTPEQVRTTLGLVIGTDVQAYDADLTTWAGLTPSANAQSLVTAANYAAMRALLDLEAGTDFYSISAADAAFQPKDADLTTIAGLTATTDNFIVSVASAWASRTPAQVKTTLSLNNVENTALSTWAGSANITTLGTIATGTWSGTIILATKGGTGTSTTTAGDILQGGALNTWSKLAGVATGNALISGGVGAAVSWGKIGLTTHVTGTLPVANGGTNAGAFTAGSVVFAGASGTYTQNNAIFKWTDGATNADYGLAVGPAGKNSRYALTISPNTVGSGAGNQGQGIYIKQELTTGTVDSYAIAFGSGGTNFQAGLDNYGNFWSGGLIVGDSGGTYFSHTTHNTGAHFVATGTAQAAEFLSTDTQRAMFRFGDPNFASGKLVYMGVRHDTDGSATVPRYMFWNSAGTIGTPMLTIYDSNTGGAGGANATGFVGINMGTTIPTAWLDLPASTTGGATLRLRTGVSPTSPNSGDIWNDSTQKANISFVDGIKQSLEGVIFTQTADKSVTNTVTETSIVGTGVGGLTLPANFWVIGKTIRVTMSGVYSTVAITGDTVTIKVKYGSTTLASKATTALVTGGTNLYWESEVLVTCRTTGATGTVQVSGGVRYQIAGSAIVEDELNNAVATTTLDTTASGLFDVTITHSAANASNTVKSLVSTFEVLN